MATLLTDSYRNSSSQVFHKIAVLKKFAKYREKRLHQSLRSFCEGGLQLYKIESPTRFFLYLVRDNRPKANVKDIRKVCVQKVNH